MENNNPVHTPRCCRLSSGCYSKGLLTFPGAVLVAFGLCLGVGNRTFLSLGMRPTSSGFDIFNVRVGMEGKL